ncbi:MAG: sigma-54-dependent transcriptional regulator [Bdellovibrionales bacterium]
MHLYEIQTHGLVLWYESATLKIVTKTALIIDDDRTERRLLSTLLDSQLSLATLEAENGQDGLDALNVHPHVKVIILDLEMPVMDGRTALAHITRDYPHIPVIVLTGSTDMRDAVEAIKAGACDFLAKPLKQERLIVAVRNALKISLMSQEISRLKRKDEGALSFSDLIGHDSGLSNSIHVAGKAAGSDIPVLITGETGTGKEMFARSIHGESKRAGQPFIAINCGAIPEKLIESTLFGHEKGAFTGAIHKALGKFQEAEGGTLFLDEIGELPLDAQVRLLRALQQKEVEPVGAGKAVKVDVRIISATNRDLAQEVKAGRFREDLYFRLNILPIKLPSLRERPQDVPRLAAYFIDLFCAAHQAVPKRLSDTAIHRLKSYHWPGNVRELENMVNRAMVLCDGDVIDAGDLSFESAGGAIDAAPIKGGIRCLRDDGSFKSFKELEQDIIAEALEHHDHNIAKTARVLGIAKSTLYAKMPTQNDGQAKAG